MIASLAGCCCNAVLAGESTSLQTSSTADELEGCLREGTDVNPKSDVNNIIHSRADETSYRGFTGITRSTDNLELDLTLDAALKRLADLFGVLPGFGFYDDFKGPNAFAIYASPPMVPNTAGTVLFGRRLFQNMMKFDPTGVAVLWTLAHEFGHIWLFMSGRYKEVKRGQPTAKRIELHADFLAGYYLAIFPKKKKKKKNYTTRPFTPRCRIEYPARNPHAIRCALAAGWPLLTSLYLTRHEKTKIRPNRRAKASKAPRPR